MTSLLPGAAIAAALTIAAPVWAQVPITAEDLTRQELGQLAATQAPAALTYSTQPYLQQAQYYYNPYPYPYYASPYPYYGYAYPNYGYAYPYYPRVGWGWGGGWNRGWGGGWHHGWGGGWHGGGGRHH